MGNPTWKWLAACVVAFTSVHASPGIASDYTFQELTYSPGEFGISSGGGGGYISPLGINDSGVVVGQTGDGETDTFTFVYNSNTNSYSTLGRVGDGNFFGVAINKYNNVFVYDFSTPDPEGPNPPNGYLAGYTTASGPFRIPQLPDDPDALIKGGINDSNEIVGSSGTQGFLLSGANTTTFEVPGASSTTPTGVSDSGEIVGDYTGGPGGGGAFFDIGGLILTEAGVNIAGISSSGEDLVGSDSSGNFVIQDGVRSTFVTPFSSGFVLLTGINSEGQVIGVANDLGFIATPVPEPASFALLGTGLLGFCFARRRRTGS